MCLDLFDFFNCSEKLTTCALELNTKCQLATIGDGFCDTNCASAACFNDLGTGIALSFVSQALNRMFTIGDCNLSLPQTVLRIAFVIVGVFTLAALIFFVVIAFVGTGQQDLDHALNVSREFDQVQSTASVASDGISQINFLDRSFAMSRSQVSIATRTSPSSPVYHANSPSVGKSPENLLKTSTHSKGTKEVVDPVPKLKLKQKTGSNMRRQDIYLSSVGRSKQQQKSRRHRLSQQTYSNVSTKDGNMSGDENQ